VSESSSAAYQRRKRELRAAEPPGLPLAELMDRRPEPVELPMVGARFAAAVREGA